MSKTTLHPKIQERKLSAGKVTESFVSLNSLPVEFQQRAKSSLDERVVEGYLFIWGVRNKHGEKLVKGCCAKSIRERGPGSNAKYEIKFLNQHRTFEPMSLFAELTEDDLGLRFKTKPLDDVEWANNVLTQLRSGTLNNFSGGFDYVWDKIQWDDSDDSLVLLEIDLYEGSVATIPSDMQTFAIRSAEDILAMEEEIDSFIETLPRKDRLQARQLFTRQKSLIDMEPLTKRLEALREGKPAEEGAIDYNYLTNNFKLN